MGQNQKAAVRKVLSTLAGKYRKTKVSRDLPVLEQGMLFILGKDSKPELARATVEKMRKRFVDWNELRVSQIPEIAEVLTPLRKDPNMISKAQRLREFINQVFNIRHTLNMEPLRQEAREKQEKLFLALECFDPYMIETFILNLSGDRGLPYNPAISRVLQRLGLISKTPSVAKLRSQIESLAPAQDAQSFYALLLRHAEEVCLPRTPLCKECSLLSACKFGKTQGNSENNS